MNILWYRVVDNYVKKYINRVWLSDWKSIEYLLVLNTNSWKENCYNSKILGLVNKKNLVLG